MGFQRILPIPDLPVFFVIRLFSKWLRYLV
jgi:hypothetical protein